MSETIRILAAIAIACVSLFASSSASHAEPDSAVSLVDGVGRTLTVQQWDTVLAEVFPLDRNRLTREWLHSGRAVYLVVGDGAQDYFSYRSPNITFGGWALDDDPIDRIYTPPLLPSVAISVDLGNGPGVLEAATFSVPVGGAGGTVAISNAHGTITGAAGGVILRPFARLLSSTGDSVTTYGEPWNMS